MHGILEWIKNKRKGELQLDLKFMIPPYSPAIGLTAKRIEKTFGIRFVNAHEDYSRILDEHGNVDMRKYIEE